MDSPSQYKWITNCEWGWKIAFKLRKSQSHIFKWVDQDV